MTQRTVLKHSLIRLFDAYYFLNPLLSSPQSFKECQIPLDGLIRKWERYKIQHCTMCKEKGGVAPRCHKEPLLDPQLESLQSMSFSQNMNVDLMRGTIRMQIYCIFTLWEVLLEGAACGMWIKEGPRIKECFNTVLRPFASHSVEGKLRRQYKTCIQNGTFDQTNCCRISTLRYKSDTSYMTGDIYPNHRSGKMVRISFPRPSNLQRTH